MPDNGEFTVPTELIYLNEVMKCKSYIQKRDVGICEWVKVMDYNKHQYNTIINW